MEVSFVDQLRARRTAKHINQAELGKMAGVSRNYISMIERGNIDNVSSGVLHRLCHALELELSYQLRPYESFQDFAHPAGE